MTSQSIVLVWDSRIYVLSLLMRCSHVQWSIRVTSHIKIGTLLTTLPGA